MYFFKLVLLFSLEKYPEVSEIAGLINLHRHVSQFLLINLSLFIHTHTHTHTPVDFVSLENPDEDII